MAETGKAFSLSVAVQRAAGCIPRERVEVTADRSALFQSGEQSWIPSGRLHPTAT